METNMTEAALSTDKAAENVTWVPLDATTAIKLSLYSQDTSMGVALLRTSASVLILAVNILIIAIFCHKRALRTLSNVFVVSLAVADLLVGVVVFVGAFTWVPAVRDFVVTSGEFCMARLCGYIVSCASSTMNICAIALERYLYIVHPYCHQRYLNKKVVSCGVGLVWLAATLFGVCPPVVLFTYTEEHTCDIYYALGPVYSVYAISVVFVLTGVPTLTLYVLIARLALEKRREFLHYVPDNEATHRINWFRKRLRAVKAPVVVFGGFFVCWFPQVFTYVVHELVVKVPRQKRAMVSNVAVLNSAVNFFVYLALNRQFREAVLLPVCRRKNGQAGSRSGGSLSGDSNQGSKARTTFTVSTGCNSRNGVGQERACKENGNEHNKIENGELSKISKGDLGITESQGRSTAESRF